MAAEGRAAQRRRCIQSTNRSQILGATRCAKVPRRGASSGWVKGSNAESGDKSSPAKTVLAVPVGSATVDVADAGPSQGRRAQQKKKQTTERK